MSVLSEEELLLGLERIELTMREKWSDYGVSILAGTRAHIAALRQREADAIALLRELDVLIDFSEQLLEDASNAAMRAAIAEAHLAAISKAAEPFVRAAKAFDDYVEGSRFQLDRLDDRITAFTLDRDGERCCVYLDEADFRALARACSDEGQQGDRG